MNYEFTKNPRDYCVYITRAGDKIVFLVLYDDDIPLATNDISLLMEIK